MFRKKGINVCSAFDGLSGAQVALDYLGIPVDKYYSLENDPYAIAITQKNYPETIQLGDIRKIAISNHQIYVDGIGGDQMPKIDLFVGGFPCQDLSFAGHQKGFQEGSRSSLFFEFLRLLDEIKPTYFLVENTLMKKEYQDIISEKLGVQPIMINSNLVSGQERKRNYWTNIPEVGQPEDLGIMLSDCLESKTDEILYEEPYVKLNGKTKGCVGYVGNEPRQATRIYSVDGKSKCITALGGGQGAKSGLYAIPEFVDRDKSYCIDANYFKGGNLKSYFEKRRRQLVFSTDEVVLNENQKRKIDKINTTTDKAGCITTAIGRGGSSYEYLSNVKKKTLALAKDSVNLTYRKLTPTEVECLQTFPKGYTEGISNTQRYKALGNAFNVLTIASILAPSRYHFEMAVASYTKSV